MNRALIIGTDPETGDSISCKSTPESVATAWGGIAWVTKAKANLYLDHMGF